MTSVTSDRQDEIIARLVSDELDSDKPGSAYREELRELREKVEGDA